MCSNNNNITIVIIIITQHIVFTNCRKLTASNLFNCFVKLCEQVREFLL